MNVSLNELSRLCGLSNTTLQRWVETGVITPAVKRDVTAHPSRYNSHRFDPMTALGVCVTAELHRSPRGCLPGFVREVVSAFASVTEGWLREQFGADLTHFSGVLEVGRQGSLPQPTLIPIQPEGVDVQVAFSRVIESTASKV